MKPNPILDELHAVRAQLIKEVGGSLRKAMQNAHETVERLGLAKRMKVLGAKPRKVQVASLVSYAVPSAQV